MHKDIECRDAILSTLSRIPCGKVCSYGQVAKLAGQSGKARYVAYILKHLPNNSKIPWHRVINSQGKISFPSGSEMHKIQSEKLLTEGIEMPLNAASRLSFTWLGN